MSDISFPRTLVFVAWTDKEEMNMKKILALLLCIAMLACVLAG